MAKETTPAIVETPSGQVEAPPVAGGEAYYEYSYPDGKVDRYATKEDLTKAWRDSYLRQSDYTHKTQDLAKERDKHQKEIDDFKSQIKAFQEMKTKYDGYDTFLTNRPDVRQALERQYSQTSPDTVLDVSKKYTDDGKQELADRLEKLEGVFKGQEEERELSGVFDSMEQKYGENFDRAKVRESLEHLSNGDTLPLVEMLHYATLGRQNAVEFQERMAESAKEKKQAAMVPPGTPVPPAVQSFDGVDDARQQAMKDAGVGV